jgi:hypothetical protein
MKTEKINIELENFEPPDFLTSRKMFFILNSLNDGWTIRKQNDNFIFTKKHEGRKEVLTEGYLKEFIVKNYRINK